MANTNLDELSTRESRNLAEKNRREKLNGFVQNLAQCVPHVRDSPRRVDKTGVLRYAAHGLRLQYVFGGSQHRHSIDDDMINVLMRLMDSFLVVMNLRGQVVLVSSSVERQLGHCQNDLLGQNMLTFTHHIDKPLVRKAIIPDNLETIFEAAQFNKCISDCSVALLDECVSREAALNRILAEDKRRFTFRFSRAGPRAEPTQYEFVRLEGYFRTADSSLLYKDPDQTYAPGTQMTRRARTRDDSLPSHINGNDIVFIATMHIIKPPSLRDRLRDACRFEYKTRHLIDGRIVQCDQRISLVAGYMADEVCGLSPFTFMHKADVRWVMIALRQMYESCDVTGESCYRLISRTGRFIYLRTEGFMEVGNSNYISSFVCRNTLMPDDEGERLLGVMKEQFSMYVNELDVLFVPSPGASPEALQHQRYQLMSPLDVMMPMVTDNSSEIIEQNDKEIETMVVGIHSMVRGLPHSRIDATAIAGHHMRDLPSDATLADIHKRRRELRNDFKYEMPDKQQIMVSVQRSIMVIKRSVHNTSDDSDVDSSGDIFAKNGNCGQICGVAPDSAGNGIGSTTSSSGSTSTIVDTNIKVSLMPHTELASAASTTAPDDKSAHNVQLTKSCTKQLLGIGPRISLEEKTENYSNLLTFSKLRHMVNLTGDQFPISPSSSMASMSSPAASCSSMDHDAEHDGSTETIETAGGRAKMTAISRSPSLIIGRPREFCSDVGGFRPEVVIRSDEQSLRNPRVKRRPRRVEPVKRVSVIEVFDTEDQPSASKRITIAETTLNHSCTRVHQNATTPTPTINIMAPASATLRAMSTAPSYEDSLGEHLSETGSDLSQMLSPSSVGSMDPSLVFTEAPEETDLDHLVIGQDLLLSTIVQDPPQSIVKQDYQVIYLPHRDGSSSGVQIDTHPQSHSIDLDDVDDICDMPR